MNPKKIFPFFWVLLFFLFQNLTGFIFPQKTPVFVLSAVLFYAFSQGPWFGALLGAYAGFLLEIFGTGRIGGEIAVFGLAGLLFGVSTKTFFRESVFVQFLMPLVVFYFVVWARLFLLFLSLGGEWRDFWVLKECYLPRDVLGMAVICPVVFFFLKKVDTDGIPQR